MAQKCIVKNCRNTSRTSALFALPNKNPVLFEKWVNAVQRFDIPMGSFSARVCINHFSKYLKNSTSNAKFIKLDAVPDTNLPPPVSPATKQKMLEERAKYTKLKNKPNILKTDSTSRKDIQFEFVDVHGDLVDDNVETNTATATPEENTFASDKNQVQDLVEDIEIKIEEPELQGSVSEDKDIQTEPIPPPTFQIIITPESVTPDAAKRPEPEQVVKKDKSVQTIELKQQKSCDKIVLDEKRTTIVNKPKDQCISKKETSTQTNQFEIKYGQLEMDEEANELAIKLKCRDLLEICRFCFKKVEVMDIFQTSFENTKLVDIIYTLSEDLMPIREPRFICLKCMDLLTQAYAFHLLYRRSSIVVNRIISKERTTFPRSETWKKNKISENNQQKIVIDNQILSELNTASENRENVLKLTPTNQSLETANQTLSKVGIQPPKFFKILQKPVQIPKNQLIPIRNPILSQTTLDPNQTKQAPEKLLEILSKIDTQPITSVNASSLPFQMLSDLGLTDLVEAPSETEDKSTSNLKVIKLTSNSSPQKIRESNISDEDIIFGKKRRYESTIEYMKIFAKSQERAAIKCVLCPFETSSTGNNRSIAKHYLVKHYLNMNKSSETAICLICKIEFHQDHVKEHFESKDHLDKCKTCSICFQSFPTDAIIKAHMKEEHNMNCRYIKELKNDFPCILCKMKFNTYIEVENHFDEEHWDSNMCVICGKICRGNVKSHMLCHLPHTVSCRDCRVSFDTFQQLQEHEDSEEHKNGLVCNICQTRCPDRKHLHRHQSSHKEKQYMCDVCGNLSMNWMQFKKHKERHLNTKYYCNKCPKFFKDYAILSIHLRRHDLICPVCQAMCTYEWQFKLHKAKHEVPTAVICSVAKCHQIFPNKESLNFHLRMNHEPYKCTSCDKQFYNFNNFKGHTSIHSWESLPEVEDPNTCKLCSKTFLLARTFFSHMHNMHKIHICHVCRQMFHNNVKLKNHKVEKHNMKILTSELGISRDQDRSRKTRTCEFCNKPFIHLSRYIAHKRIHTGEKPFICSHCGRGFATKYTKMLHERTHTGDKRFACSICGRKFIQPGDRKKHEQRHFKNEIVVEAAPKVEESAVEETEQQVIYEVQEQPVEETEEPQAVEENEEEFSDETNYEFYEDDESENSQEIEMDSNGDTDSDNIYY